MDEWLTIADGSGRNTPYLWVGPNAAGHLKPPSLILQEGNNALWHYNVELGKEAAKRAVENLSMYNMTLQASSWDGSRYGQKVEIVQAMMVSLQSVTDDEKPFTDNVWLDYQLACQVGDSVSESSQATVFARR